MKVKSESEDAQPYPTLSDPMDCSHGIFQARVPEWGAIAFSERIYYLIHSIFHKTLRVIKKKKKKNQESIVFPFSGEKRNRHKLRQSGSSLLDITKTPST